MLTHTGVTASGWAPERTVNPVWQEHVLRTSSFLYYVTIESSTLAYLYIMNISLNLLYILRKFTFIIYMKTFRQFSLANVS